MLTATALLLISIVAPSGSPDSLNEAFRRMLTTEYAIIARGDTARLGVLLSNELAWVIGATGGRVGKAALLAGVARTQSPAPQFLVDSVQARLIDRVALVDYLRSDRRTARGYTVTTRSRCHDVFTRRGSTWVLEQHSQAYVVTPVVATGESPPLDDFIGHYRIAGDFVDDVHREGARLVATASGQTVGATLVPVSANAFSPDGVGALMVFERDRSGRVIGYVQGYPDGRVVRAVRLP